MEIVFEVIKMLTCIQHLLCSNPASKSLYSVCNVQMYGFSLCTSAEIPDSRVKAAANPA